MESETNFNASDYRLELLCELGLPLLALIQTACFALRYFTYLEPLKMLTEYLADIPEILHLCDDNDEGGADNVFLIRKPLTN